MKYSPELATKPEDSGLDLKAGAALEMSIVRVLVVDDYEPFRLFICSALRRKPGFQIVGESSDGLEAVHRAEELQPDLIVLDIGLPTLNGIEAARRIQKLSAKSKILFVSQESSADVAREALSAGAMGYVVKACAGSELLSAVGAVLEDNQFISSGLSGDHFTAAASAVTALDSIFPNQAFPSLVPENTEISRGHKVEFYSDDVAFVEGFTYFIEAALKAGKAVVVVSTESHQKSLLHGLQEHGVNVPTAIEQGRYLSLDVADTLSSFMMNDLLDPVRFFGVVGDLIAAAARATAGEESQVAICGECASVLWAQGNADSAIQVEQFCHQLTKRFEIDILCGFSLSSFSCEQDKQIFQKICSE
jgi:DNA-binding NarL/FixJ family response regulator